MKKTIIEIALGLVIVALAYFLYSSIMKPVKFENEFDKRRDACAEKLKAIRTLEEAYNLCYNGYTGSFDTLFNRLMNEDSMSFKSIVVDREKVARDGADSILDNMTEAQAIEKGYKVLTKTFVNPIKHLREEGKLTLTDEEILNLRYVPYPKGEKLEFTLAAGNIQTTSGALHVFECKVDLDDLMSDLDHQLLVNKKATLEDARKYPGWKVGSLEEAIVDGNFE